jgi:hypothetical protein
MPLEKLADSVHNCAVSLGLGVATFREQFIKSGLVTPVDLGGRGESIIISELKAAIEKRAAEQKADPSLKQPRSAGAKLAAEGRIGNPLGFNGKGVSKGKPAKVPK